MKNRKEAKYKKLMDLLIKQIQKARIPKFLSKYSKKIYSIWQHIVLHCFRQMLNLSYREFVDWLESSKLMDYLNLKNVPHYTTLQKVTKRLKPLWIQRAINSFTKNSHLFVGVDATGFGILEGSSYYCKRALIVGKKKRYTKLSILADLKSQLVMECNIRMFPAHDNLDFLPLVRKLKGKKIDCVAADKGYDSGENHKFVLQTLNAQSLIAIKNYGDKKHRNWRKDWRKIAKKQFDEKKYHQRSKLETIFSVIKRLFGSIIRSRKFYTRKLDLLFKVLVYNTRKIFLFLFEDFYRAVF